MGISQRQRQTITDQALITTLRTGNLPNTKDINQYVDRFFANKTLGLPYYQPAPAITHECSDPNVFNRMFSQLGTDLNTIFDEDTYQNNRIIAMFDYYMTEKERLDAQTEKLELRLNALLNSLKSNKATEGFIESFNNFYGIELYGDRLRNIPKTTAFIDLIQRKVYNEKLTRAQDKIDISTGKVTITPISKLVSNYTLGVQENIVKDSLNETFTYVGVQDTDRDCTVQLIVEMVEAKTASSVIINTKSTKAANIRLAISEDNINFRDLLDIETASFAEWNFNKTPIRYLRFTIKKYEPDADDGTNSEYYYTLVNISLVNDNFINKTVLVSKPVTINKIANQATLYAEDIIYPNTDIKYYLGLDNGIDKVDWRLITNGEPYDFGLLNPKHDIVTGITSSYDFDPIKKVSRIYKLHDNTDTNTINLMMGYQMWFGEVFDIPLLISGELDKAGNNIFEPGIRHMTHPKSNHFFVDCEKYDHSVMANKMYVYTQYIVCADNYSLTKRKISGIGIKHAIYVNNVAVPAIDGFYTIHTVKGINKIQVCIFSDTDNNLVNHNINMKSASFDIYCKLALQPVTEHNLLSNTKDNDMNYYAVDSQGYILVKYDPTAVGLTFNINNTDYIRYVIDYKYIPGAILTAYPDNITKFRVMATMTSSYDDLSPQIINYRMISE